MNIKINSVKGAYSYTLENSLDGKEYKRINVLYEPTTISQESLEIGKTYYYRVRVCNKNGYCSEWTTVNKKQTTLSPTFKLSTSKKKVTINITSINGADGYEVYRSTSKKKGYKLQGEVTDLVLENTTKKGKTYYYKVRSYKLVDGKKVYSSYIKIKSIKSK